MELAHKKAFEDNCATNYIDKAGTSGNKSKTVCQEKSEKIKSILKGDIPAGCSPAFVFWVKKTFNTFNRGYIQACVSFTSHVFFITLNSYSIIMIKLDVNRVFCRLATPVMSLCHTKELFPSNCLLTCRLFQSSHLEKKLLVPE